MGGVAAVETTQPPNRCGSISSVADNVSHRVGCLFGIQNSHLAARPRIFSSRVSFPNPLKIGFASVGRIDLIFSALSTDSEPCGKVGKKPHTRSHSGLHMPTTRLHISGGNPSLGSVLWSDVVLTGSKPFSVGHERPPNEHNKPDHSSHGILRCKVIFRLSLAHEYAQAVTLTYSSFRQPRLGLVCDLDHFCDCQLVGWYCHGFFSRISRVAPA